MAKRFDFDAPDCTCEYRNGIVARNMVGHTPPCPVYARWMAEHGQAYQPQPSAAGPAKDTTLTMLYQVCPLCQGKGEFLARSNRDAEEEIRPCPCKTLRVVEVGVTTGQLEGLVKLDQLRQDAGITAAMLRDGRAAKLVQEIEQLRAALLPFGAAGRPGRLTDCMTDQPLPDDAVLGLGVKVAAWKRAAELTEATEPGGEKGRGRTLDG